jgi:hypothetical protein
MSHDNNMRPQDREAFRTVQTMLAILGVPLVTAVDEYVRCRRKLGEVPLESAVDLNRRIIELRPGPAKTASRRVVPITDNLAAWLTPVKKESGPLADRGALAKLMCLAKKLKVTWPHNALRHSFISCRISVVPSAAQVALEAGNSPAIIFKHYRELVTKEAAAEWFNILPLS